MSRTISRFALVVLIGVCAACGGDDDPITPTEPTPTAVTETFSGTVTRNGAITHAFIVERAGQTTAAITALTPSDAVVGLSIGPLSVQACTQAVARENATMGTQIIGTASAGNFCVRVFDPNGSLTAAVDYTISVTHF
jgi:hypothetical protein